jgi:tRNA-2-methylthio-N6-dimethylallyladenosine synthase
MKKFYIITYGCQSNISDSERIITVLEKRGYRKALNKDDADLIYINACSIRQSAVDRMFGQIINIQKKDKKKIIVTGCLLEKDKKKVSKMVEFQEISNVVKVNSDDIDYLDVYPSHQSFFSALVPIMTGCNNFCTYCAVPFTRGRERSRSSEKILEEINSLISNRYKEIWLLGQNVNSYKNKDNSFVSLLESIEKIYGDFWIRFMSSHPKDYLEKSNNSWKNLIELIKNSKKITEYINLPVQSGNDEILKKMNRPYNIKEYKDCLSLIKKNIPDAGISTDVIVGFPGEDEKKFKDTVNLFKEMKYDMAYISKYSPRPGTLSAKMIDDVTPQEKNKREKILSDILKKTSMEKSKKLKGKTVDVLVEKQNKEYLIGKTKNYKTVRFKGDKKNIGNFVKVKINKQLSWGLQGEINKK